MDGWIEKLLPKKGKMGQIGGGGMTAFSLKCISQEMEKIKSTKVKTTNLNNNPTEHFKKICKRHFDSNE